MIESTLADECKRHYKRRNQVKQPQARRLSAALALAAALAALPLVAATPAAAGERDCALTVEQAGFDIGSNVQAACQNAKDVFSVSPNPKCMSGLTGRGVPLNIAWNACWVA